MEETNLDNLPIFFSPEEIQQTEGERIKQEQFYEQEKIKKSTEEESKFTNREKEKHKATLQEILEQDTEKLKEEESESAE